MTEDDQFQALPLICSCFWFILKKKKKKKDKEINKFIDVIVKRGIFVRDKTRFLYSVTNTLSPFNRKLRYRDV